MTNTLYTLLLFFAVQQAIAWYLRWKRLLEVIAMHLETDLPMSFDSFTIRQLLRLKYARETSR